MKSYFAGCHDLSEAKTRYRELMLDNHPDRLTQRAQEINAEYLIVKNDALPDGLLPERYYADLAGAERTVYIDRVVDRIIEKPIYHTKTIYKDRVVEKVVVKVVKEYVYRDVEQNKFAKLCDEQPGKYFVHNGIEFRPPLNRREAEDQEFWQSWQQMW